MNVCEDDEEVEDFYDIFFNESATCFICCVESGFYFWLDVEFFLIFFLVYCMKKLWKEEDEV